MHKRGIKITEEGFKVLDDMITHRRDTRLPSPDKKDLFYWEIIEAIGIFFKNDKDAYQNFLKTEWKRNA